MGAIPFDVADRFPNVLRNIPALRAAWTRFRDAVDFEDAYRGTNAERLADAHAVTGAMSAVENDLAETVKWIYESPLAAAGATPGGAAAQYADLRGRQVLGLDAADALIALRRHRNHVSHAPHKLLVDVMFLDCEHAPTNAYDAVSQLTAWLVRDGWA